MRTYHHHPVCYLLSSRYHQQVFRENHTSSTSSTSTTTSTSKTIIASTSSVLDSSTSSTKLPINLISPMNQCYDSGLVNFVYLDNFDCTVICSNADSDYYEDEDFFFEDSGADIYQDVPRPDGIACKYHGHCLNGECANMSTINDSKLLNKGEKEEHNVPIDLSDIDDDVKEFADNIEVDI